jgi:hypothetical protein
MGAGQSDLYKGTYGDNIQNIPDALKGRNVLPKDDSQLKHIFRKAKGHLEDSPQNRQNLLDLANNIKHYGGKDRRGLDWYYNDLGDGSQLWVTTRNGVIQDGGLNVPPHQWDERTGLSHNIFGAK